MLESQYHIAKGISYVIYFISFVISILLIPIIEKTLAGRFNGFILSGIVYLVAFALMMFVFPRILLMLYR